MPKPDDLDPVEPPQASREQRIERDMQAADTANGERTDEGTDERGEDGAAPHRTGEAQAQRNAADDPPA